MEISYAVHCQESRLLNARVITAWIHLSSYLMAVHVGLASSHIGNGENARGEKVVLDVPVPSLSIGHFARGSTFRTGNPLGRAMEEVTKA